jgi:glutamate-ammonia-ligase adenylyltransferase
MRQKLREHHGVDNAEVKHAAGGVVDLEFISQYLVLAYAATFPALYQYSDNIRILDAAVVAGLMSLEQAGLLQQAYRDLRGVSHRLTLEPVDTTDLPDVSTAMQQVQASWASVLGNEQALPH